MLCFLHRNMVPSNLIEATFQQVRENTWEKTHWAHLHLTNTPLSLCSTRQTWSPSSKSQPEPSSQTSSTSSRTRATPKVGQCTWSWLRPQRSCTRRVPAPASRWTSSASSSSPRPWVSGAGRWQEVAPESVEEEVWTRLTSDLFFLFYIWVTAA